jgi:uncharacterized protein DUF397
MRTPEQLVFAKSSFSLDDDCVEWGYRGRAVYLRDSKDPTGLVLIASHEEWVRFTACVEADVASHGELRYRHLAGLVVVFAISASTRLLAFDAAEWAAFVLGIRAGETSLTPAA